MSPRQTVDSLYPHEGSSLLSSSTRQTASFSSDNNNNHAPPPNNDDDPSHQQQQNHSPKSIGTWGSLAIAINSLAGPAILQLPFQYQQSGLIPTTLCLIIVAVLSMGCCQCMAYTVRALPHNSKFTLPIEFSDVFTYFWSPQMYQITQVLFFGCTLCLNVAAMIDTAEVVDTTLGVSSIGTWGLDVTSGTFVTWNHVPCTRKAVKLGQCDPFSDAESSFLLTLGYLITAAVFVPICLMDLKENTAWQMWGCTLLITLSLYFCYVFLHLNHHDGTMVWQELDPLNDTPLPSHPNVTLWGHEYNNLLGVILFNFALVLAIPAWLHEKQVHVSVSHVVGTSTAIATTLYIGVGALAAWAIPHANVNMLTPMVSGAFGTGMQYAASLFAFFIIGLDIPLFSVLTRYNLTHSGLCSERMANWLVVWIPWSMAWLLYQGDAVGTLLDWGGTLLTSAVAFILPLYLAWRVLVYYTNPNDDPATTTDSVVSLLGVTTRSSQIRVVTALLVVTVAAIAVAVAGQIAATDEMARILNSDDYLNGTVQRMMMT